MGATLMPATATLFSTVASSFLSHPVYNCIFPTVDFISYICL